MRYLFLCSLYLLSQDAISQKEATYWFFGAHAGLYFNHAGPVPEIGSKMLSQDGCAVMSDKSTGELLFYSNGRNVWNRDHKQMPNSLDFQDDCWSGIIQSALIVPMPGESTKYYLFSIFYTSEIGGSIFIKPNCDYSHYSTPLFRELRYSIVDMSLDNGLGDIVSSQKYVPLQTNVTDKLTAIPHSNGSDYWIITHEFNSNSFIVFLLSSAGISVPTSINIGSPHVFKEDGLFQDEESWGQMKASPDGRRIACAVSSGKRPLDMFDFDASTGLISNYTDLGLVGGQFGISFSPDNTKLYVTSADRPNPSEYPYPDVILQFDLGAGDIEAIRASRRSLFRDNTLTNVPGHGTFDGFLLLEMSMQLGLDGKLYVTGDYAYAPSGNGIMVIIEKPNVAGVGCEVNYQSFDFGGGAVGTGLPNFIQSYFNGLESSTTCSEEPALVLYPNPTPDNVNIQFLQGCYPWVKIDIINVLGQHVGSLEKYLEQTKVDISNLQPGLYYFLITTLYDERLIKKVVKL